jgi:hypothetical protein
MTQIRPFSDEQSRLLVNLRIPTKWAGYSGLKWATAPM